MTRTLSMIVRDRRIIVLTLTENMLMSMDQNKPTFDSRTLMATN